MIKTGPAPITPIPNAGVTRGVMGTLDTDDVRMFRCDYCDSDGWVEGEPYGYNPHDGTPISHICRCTYCENGFVPVAHVLIDEDDFEECFGEA